jgi:flagellar hook assembly protein FlgD
VRKVYQIGITDKGITAYAVDQNNELYMLGIDGKIYTFQSTVVSTVREDDPDRGYTMLKSHPNPTSGSTLVTYDLLKHGRVTLSIHDINGNPVRNLVDESLAGGAYTVSWDGVNDNGARVASGAYLCRLSVDGKPVATEQIVLVR